MINNAGVTGIAGLTAYAAAAEQAASILFLASDDSTHMTRATVATDGGFTAY